jgi:hypothetical protein
MKKLSTDERYILLWVYFPETREILGPKEQAILERLITQGLVNEHRGEYFVSVRGAQYL